MLDDGDVEPVQHPLDDEPVVHLVLSNAAGADVPDLGIGDGVDVGFPEDVLQEVAQRDRHPLDHLEEIEPLGTTADRQDHENSQKGARRRPSSGVLEQTAATGRRA